MNDEGLADAAALTPFVYLDFTQEAATIGGRCFDRRRAFQTRGPELLRPRQPMTATRRQAVLLSELPTAGRRRDVRRSEVSALFSSPSPGRRCPCPSGSARFPSRPRGRSRYRSLGPRPLKLSVTLGVSTVPSPWPWALWDWMPPGGVPKPVAVNTYVHLRSATVHRFAASETPGLFTGSRVRSAAATRTARRPFVVSPSCEY